MLYTQPLISMCVFYCILVLTKIITIFLMIVIFYEKDLLCYQKEHGHIHLKLPWTWSTGNSRNSESTFAFRFVDHLYLPSCWDKKKIITCLTQEVHLWAFCEFKNGQHRPREEKKIECGKFWFERIIIF